MSNPSAKRQGERGFSLLLVVFSVTAFWQSYAISGFTGLSTPGVFPMLASGTMVLASLCILLHSVRHSNESSITSLNSQAGDTEGFIQSILPPQVVIVVLLITGYVIAMPLLGFLLSSAIFLFVSFSYLWRKPVVISFLVTLVSVVLVYFIFRKLFQVVLPNGSLLQAWF